VRSDDNCGHSIPFLVDSALGADNGDKLHKAKLIDYPGTPVSDLAKLKVFITDYCCATRGPKDMTKPALRCDGICLSGPQSPPCSCTFLGSSRTAPSNSQHGVLGDARIQREHFKETAATAASSSKHQVQSLASASSARFSHASFDASTRLDGDCPERSKRAQLMRSARALASDSPRARSRGGGDKTTST
jgi:hypothetical protein